MPTETVLITGASSGIGLELARLFAADKSHLVLVARNAAKLEQLAQELRKQHGVDVHVVIQDLADPRAASIINGWLDDRQIAIDTLVNNAGFGAIGRFLELPLDRQLEMIQVNVTALVHLTRLLLPGMIERRRGAILNVGSTAGFQPGPYHAIYFATKAFVVSFTEALAEELARTPIKVTCLAPGITATGFTQAAQADDTILFRSSMMDAATVARAGYRGLRAGKLLIVPGVSNKLGIFANRVFPRIVVRKFVKAIQKPRRKPR